MITYTNNNMFKKLPYTTVSEQLDKFFFLPFGKNESPMMRAEALDAYLKVSGWSWDDILKEISKVGGDVN